MKAMKVMKAHKFARIGLSCLFLWASFLPVSESSAAILLEDGGRSIKAHSVVKTAENGFSLRRIRRVAVGVSAAGALGVAGAELELCFNPESGFVGGFGGGKGFQAFSLQYKRVLGGENFLPYVTAGVSRWYNVGKPSSVSEGTSPSILADRLLNESQKSSGSFEVSMVHPGFGVQVMQPSGPWAGTSVFFEAVMLLNIESFVAAPTGSLGLLYYF
jgi:hypothetical protein